MRYPLGKLVVLLSIILLIVPLVLACGGNGEEEPPPLARPNGEETPTPPPTGEAIITIGNLTDLTGVSAAAQSIINQALDDLVKYFNEEDLIPGGRLEIETYDGSFDPANDIPGYEWLRNRGAELLVTGVTGTPVTLKARLDRDEFPLFTWSGNSETLDPPGYVFSPATLPEHEALTLLTWIAENDWDYENNGPAKIGGVAWNEPNSETFLEAAEAYAKAHPEQFEFVGAYLVPLGTFTWSQEAQAVMDCDYVFPNTIMTTFVKELRNAGSTAKLIGTGVHAAFLGSIHDANLWEEINGTLFIFPSRWYNEEGKLVNLRNKLLRGNHSPEEAKGIRKQGAGYQALDNEYVVLDIVRQAAENVGAANVDPAAIYEAATSYSLVIDGIERYSFTDTKRYAANYYAIYEAVAAEKDLFRADPEWYYRVDQP